MIKISAKSVAKVAAVILQIWFQSITVYCQQKVNVSENVFHSTWP